MYMYMYKGKECSFKCGSGGGVYKDGAQTGRVLCLRLSADKQYNFLDGTQQRPVLRRCKFRVGFVHLSKRVASNAMNGFLGLWGPVRAGPNQMTSSWQKFGYVSIRTPKFVAIVPLLGFESCAAPNESVFLWLFVLA